MTYGFILIEVCDANEAAGVLAEFAIEHPDVVILENECMSHCELCRSAPYALMNGELIVGKTVADLLDQLAARIEQQQAESRDF